MPTRRAFLQTLAATTWAAPLWAAPSRLRPRIDRLGIQLYTLRSLIRSDGLEHALALVSEIGYREVEFTGYFDHAPSEIRGMLERTGLAAPAAHVEFPQIGDAWNRTLDLAAEIGHRYVVTPWISQEWRTPDGYARAAQVFNRAGEAALARGLTFAYHNHDFEFVAVAGRRGFDILLELTDAALVTVEMDLFWVTRGGGDPLEYFDRYPGRFPMVHVKDMAAGGVMVDVGRGRIDFQKILGRASQAGIRHYFVEHDRPADPAQTARNSYQYLRRLNP